MPLDEKLKSEVHIYPPNGYEIESNKVCLLKKHLYGLTERPRELVHECFHYFTNKANFERSKLIWPLSLLRIHW